MDPETTQRREFLLKLAKGTIYAAPVIRTLAAPDHLPAQSLSMKGMSGMDRLDGTVGAAATWKQVPSPASPWAAPSPWKDGGPRK